MRYKRENDVGKIIGRYKILDVIRKNKIAFYKAICENGHERVVNAQSLIYNKNKCFRCDKENPQYKTRTYNCWDAMLQRCLNPNASSYWKYGAVGITVQDSWSLPDGQGFKNFLEDMGECPEGMSIDRWPDKFGNYCKENVRWATNSEQGYNQKKRSTNTSGRTGVSWDAKRSKWHSQIWKDNQKFHLGYFDNFEDAVKAREEAELKYFGEIKE